MKIGLVSYHALYAEGGIKTHIFSLQKEFKKRGIECKIIAPRRSRKENYGPDVLLLGTSFPVTSIGTQGDLCIGFNPLSIKRALKKERFDVLHFHNMGLPLSMQILQESNSLNILTFHANLVESNDSRKFIYPLQELAKKYLNGIIGVAPMTLKPFDNFTGPKQVIPNGIDLERFNSKNPGINKFLDNKINLLFLNRIEERKGLIYLLKAFKILNKEFSNLRLIIVGEGDLRNECENFVKDNKLSEVCFEGQQRSDIIPSYYATADIYVAPSIFGESFGIVLLEAMATGKPIVAFANKGYKGVLTGKKGGILVPPKDYEAMAKELRILIKNEDLRKEMGEWGIKEAQDYSWDKIAQRVLDFYNLCSLN
ncbi:glycosyltransferase family 4 protein [Patescibacteria group bacterium]|nr:glycosyltransferase family 4 protein [Patescibacteria group bacterium]MBU1877004.1 glycosyltransferase family 4 protein [Patescibacteria group bacterium]